MRQAADARCGARRLLKAIAMLLPAATLAQEATIGLAGEDVVVGFRGRLGGATLRRLQNEDDCTGKTSVGDAEAGIAQYSDPDACLRDDPLVGCNGEWVGHVLVVLADTAAAGCIAGLCFCFSFGCVANSLSVRHRSVAVLSFDRYTQSTCTSPGLSLSQIPRIL